MMERRRWDGSGAFKVATAGATLLAALATSCSLSTGGLDSGMPGATSSGGTPGATSGSGGGGTSGSTSGSTEGAGGGAGGADPTTGSGGGGGTTSASTATGGTTSTIVWNSYDVVVDTSTAALSVPAAAPATMPTAKLIAYQAGTLDDMSTKVDLNAYHKGTIDSDELSWYVTPGKSIDVPYVGRSATARTTNEGGVEPLSALDLQVSLSGASKSPVFVGFEVPVGGTYTLKDVAVRQIYSLTDNTVLVVHLKRGGASATLGEPLTADGDKKWRQSTTPYDLGMSLDKGDQIVFEVEPNAVSYYDAIELAWTIEATVH